MFNLKTVIQSLGTRTAGAVENRSIAGTAGLVNNVNNEQFDLHLISIGTANVSWTINNEVMQLG